MKLFLVLTLLMGGCSSYKTYNQTTTGKVLVKGGIYQDQSWDDDLVFKRMSWYHGLTLYYDALLHKADPTSPFARWFSPSEKEFFTKCESLIVALTYSADPSKISHVNFREQMKLNGYDDVVLNNFSSYLKTHPSLQEWKLMNYKVLGYCKRAPSKMKSPNIVINFPSFKTLEVQL